MNANIKYLVLLIIVFILTGCATAISKNIRAEAQKDIFFDEVKKDTEAFRGSIVIWGGDIINVTNHKENTKIEVLQKPMDFNLKPRNTDQSEGRFMVVADGYLDPAIYTRGRQLTVAGEIVSQTSKPLGEIEYIYPLVEAKEIHLWPDRRIDTYPHPYPYYYPVRFHWWYYPYW